MLKKEIEQRQAIEMLCTDMLVPQDHLLRKIDKAVDLTHIYEIVEGFTHFTYSCPCSKMNVLGEKQKNSLPVDICYFILADLHTYIFPDII